KSLNLHTQAFELVRLGHPGEVRDRLSETLFDIRLGQDGELCQVHGILYGWMNHLQQNQRSTRGPSQPCGHREGTLGARRAVQWDYNAFKHIYAPYNVFSNGATTIDDTFLP